MYPDEKTKLIKIGQFLVATSGFIKEVVKIMLEMSGCTVTEHNDGLNLCYKIQYKDNEVCLFFRNLYLDIATIDRDAEPLEFDRQLNDFNYFLTKTVSTIHLRLKTLLKLLKHDDVDKAIENILKDLNGGRIFIQKIGRLSSD
jgi:hypothetical protein